VTPAVPRRGFQPNEVSAGGVVVRAVTDGNEAVLVCDGRHWGLPKGNLEDGETPEVAALREVSEETGIVRETLSVIAELAPSDYVYRRRDTGRLVFKRVHQYLMTAPPGTELHRQESEIADAAWPSFEDAQRRASFDDTRRALREAEQLLQSGVMGGTS
jgi:8-oxo-dGTP pyrophosphatase MutT (NUDIX family)